VSATCEDWRRVCWGGELEFLELAAVGGDFLRKRARETSEAPACMLTLRLSSRRQCARWESAEEVVGAAVAVTEDRRVAVVVSVGVLGEDMGRAAAEGIQTDGTALSHTSFASYRGQSMRADGAAMQQANVPKQDPKQGDAAR
jgi:hypothetical protein